MQIQALTSPVRSYSASHRGILATAAGIAALSTGALVFASSDDGSSTAVSVPRVATVVQTADAPSYDAALLRHHGIKVPAAAAAAATTVQPTAAQQAAADRFHHR